MCVCVYARECVILPLSPCVCVQVYEVFVAMYYIYVRMCISMCMDAYIYMCPVQWSVYIWPCDTVSMCFIRQVRMCVHVFVCSYYLFTYPCMNEYIPLCTNMYIAVRSGNVGMIVYYVYLLFNNEKTQTLLVGVLIIHKARKENDSFQTQQNILKNTNSHKTSGKPYPEQENPNIYNSNIRIQFYLKLLSVASIWIIHFKKKIVNTTMNKSLKITTKCNNHVIYFQVYYYNVSRKKLSKQIKIHKNILIPNQYRFLD